MKKGKKRPRSKTKITTSQYVPDRMVPLILAGVLPAARPPTEKECIEAYKSMIGSLVFKGKLKK